MLLGDSVFTFPAKLPGLAFLMGDGAIYNNKVNHNLPMADFLQEIANDLGWKQGTLYYRANL